MAQWHTAQAGGRPRIVVVGAGFAGLACVRRLERVLEPQEADIVLVTPTSHSLYLPLLPQVASGVLASNSVAVPLARLLRRTIRIPGGALGVDPVTRAVIVKKITGEDVELRYDHLVLAPGSVTRTFDIPGLARHGRGMKTLQQALGLRDHVLAQLELAAAAPTEHERRARLQFVVVGGGYAGTETAACLQTMTVNAAEKMPGLNPAMVRWTLVDMAHRLMPELGDQLGIKAMEMLTARGLDFRLGSSVAGVDDELIRLTDGTRLPSKTLIWTAGVAASPLVRSVGETDHGRLIVDADLRVPQHPEILALGDAAAVPDLARQRTGTAGAVCPPTAQHAQRQGRIAAENVVAALRGTNRRQYYHRDLGLVVDLGGPRAVARPLGIQLSGLPAQAATRGYHLFAMPSVRSRLRVAGNWLSHGIAGDDLLRVDMGVDRPRTLAGYEFTDMYPSAQELQAILSGFTDGGTHDGDRHPVPAGAAGGSGGRAKGPRGRTPGSPSLD
ncbi:MAG TPA: FAD-dependent oxidoreductase [Actinocrinis sp.]|nr:FAD-dependent oxidoreductase [Actinocrinis sp.]